MEARSLGRHRAANYGGWAHMQLAGGAARIPGIGEPSTSVLVPSITFAEQIPILLRMPLRRRTTQQASEPAKAVAGHGRSLAEQPGDVRHEGRAGPHRPESSRLSCGMRIKVDMRPKEQQLRPSRFGSCGAPPHDLLAPVRPSVAPVHEEDADSVRRREV